MGVHTWVLGSAPGLELLIQLGSFTFSDLASPATSKYRLLGPTCGISAVNHYNVDIRNLKDTGA